MKTYLDSLKFVLDNGTIRPDRTSTGTIGVFGMQQRYDLSKGFPAVTTKRLAFKACLSELLWFIEGSGDEKRLRELLHGSRDSEKSTIWTANATATYWTPKAKFAGDLGRVYGVQWRHWRNGSKRWTSSTEYEEGGVDQLLQLIEGIKQDPYGRRHILTAWNPGELDQMALPPCHCFAQFYVSADNKLSCQMYQRSCDMFLGVPFNIASYSLLTHMIAQVCGLRVGEFVHVLGDAHIYLNHVDQVKEQLQREPLPAPQLWINPTVTDITKFTMEDFKLNGYESLASIKAPMAV
jgi:thymidylate synthase